LSCCHDGGRKHEEGSSANYTFKNQSWSKRWRTLGTEVERRIPILNQGIVVF